MNVILLHGSNAYLSMQRLSEIVLNYKSKYGDNSVIKFDGGNCLVTDILNEIESVSMFVPQKLIVVKYFSQNKDSKSIVEYFEKKNFKNLSNVDLVFWENSMFDKRLSFYKFMNKSAKVEEFKDLSEKQLQSWIEKEFEKREKKISKDAVIKITERVGEEMWRIGSEIDKLCVYVDNDKISVNDVEAIVPISASVEVWSLTNSIAKSDRKSALANLERLILQGNDIHQIWGLIVWQFRQLILIGYEKSLNKSAEAIAASLKISPFVVKKTMSMATGINLPKLRVLYDKLSEIDFQIKVSATEPLFAVTLLLSAI